MFNALIVLIRKVQEQFMYLAWTAKCVDTYFEATLFTEMLLDSILKCKISTVCFRDLAKLNLPMVVQF